MEETSKKILQEQSMVTPKSNIHSIQNYKSPNQSQMVLSQQKHHNISHGSGGKAQRNSTVGVSNQQKEVVGETRSILSEHIQKHIKAFKSSPRGEIPITK